MECNKLLSIEKTFIECNLLENNLVFTFTFFVKLVLYAHCFIKSVRNLHCTLPLSNEPAKGILNSNGYLYSQMFSVRRVSRFPHSYRASMFNVRLLD